MRNELELKTGSLSAWIRLTATTYASRLVGDKRLNLNVYHDNTIAVLLDTVTLYMGNDEDKAVRIYNAQ